MKKFFKRESKLDKWKGEMRQANDLRINDELKWLEKLQERLNKEAKEEVYDQEAHDECQEKTKYLTELKEERKGRN